MTTPDLAGAIIPPPRVPRATYRLQLHAQFTFQDARAIVPYLADLGISDCYVSPILMARPGSMHGYDICDHGRLNPELGTEDDFAAFAADLRARGMGLLVDVVPNHMGINCECNGWWMDVLENGPSSIYARYFDIDWQPVKVEIANKVLLPILGEEYGLALEHGAMQVDYDNGAFTLKVYASLPLPIAPRTYRALLSYRLPAVKAALGDDHADIQEWESIITALDHLPPPTETDPDRLVERNREKEVTKRRIAALYTSSEGVREAIDATVREFNGTPGDPASFDLLDALIAAQSYRPAYWRVAAEEINYRRFFDIDELAAIHMEDPEVFDATHALLFRLLAAGQVTGLRIDHPDGLWDPAQYFRWLQDRYVTEHARAWLRDQAAADADTDVDDDSDLRARVEEALATWRATLAGSYATAHPWPLYLVVEKILSEHEPLPLNWPVAGTTGYDFMNAVNDVCVPRENEAALTRIYQEFSKNYVAYSTLVQQSKRLIMNSALTSEINALGHQLERITERNRRYRDYTLNTIIYALRETITYFQVYRTYTTPDAPVAERDTQYILAAISAAKRHNQRIAGGIFDFIADTLLLRNLDQFQPDDRRAILAFVMKFQQVTGPIMAKSLEDTAFYVYNRLVSLNEVGGNPAQFGASVTAFHEQNTTRAARWPHSLLATTTHDTKRNEDVRARIDVLAELPDEWAAALARWQALNAAARTPEVGGADMPAANDEYLLYQTLIGVWPNGDLTPAAHADLRERMTAYMEKAAQEAKRHTSWVNPNQQYLDALRAFVATLLDPRADNAFLRDFLPFQRRIAAYGQYNSLAQTLLKLAAPGVPDFYQGTELWAFSLVDPDNRRPVDYAQRQALLADLRQRRDAAANVPFEAGAGEATESQSDDLAAFCRSLLDDDADGRSKLYTIQAALAVRLAKPEVFAQGAYRALEARGDRWQHACAFAREHAGTSVIAIAPRLIAALLGDAPAPPLGQAVWHDTWLTLPDTYAGRTYRDCFTGQTLVVGTRDGVPCLPVAATLAHFPVALLVQA